LKPNTITQALNRAIEKNPADEPNIRAYIVGDLLLRAGLDSTDAADDPATTIKVAAMPDYGMADDPSMRYPWPLNKVQRQWFDDAYQRERPMEQVARRVETTYGHRIEKTLRPLSRYDYAMRMCQWKRQHAMATVAEIEFHAKEYHLSPAHEAELDEAKATVSRMDEYLAAANQHRPAFLEELAENEAVNGRALAPWEVEERERAVKARAEREREDNEEGYIDEEDAAMKRAERGEW
jgi:hypothetical protein